MAIAYYIPDQARLLRKARQQELQLLRLRESKVHLLATIMLESLLHFMDAAAAAATNTANCLPRGVRKCGKWRKPSQ